MDSSIRPLSVGLRELGSPQGSRPDPGFQHGNRHYDLDAIALYNAATWKPKSVGPIALAADAPARTLELFLESIGL